LATSGTTIFTVSANSICLAALRGLHVYGPADTVPATDITYCMEALNIIVKAIAAKGTFIWTVNEIVLPLAANVASYPIGTTAAYLASATITNGGTGGTTGTYALTITGGGGTGATGTYTIAGGTITSIAITAGGNSFTSSPALSFPLGSISGAVATANIVGLTTNRPMRLLSGFKRDSSGNDVDVQIVSRQDYNQNGQKSSLGVPNQMWYDPQLTNGILTLYDVPSDSLSSMHLTIQRQVQDFNASTDNPDFPQECYQMLKWSLMDEIGLEYEATKTTMQICAAKAMKFQEDMVSFEQEECSVFFQPRMM
jgi:hypothetical protein